MVKAVRVHRHGGPEALVVDEIEVPPPGPGEVRVRQRAVGLNYIDVYFRTGLYAAPSLPFALGNEGAGEVVAVGPGVTGLAEGDRVAYVSGLGAYAEERNVPAGIVVRLPDHISDETAAAMMLKGLTAQYLLRRTYREKGGDTIIWHAAAGGVGLIRC